MDKNTYLELSYETQMLYMAEVKKIYDSLDSFSKFIILDFMCEDNIFENKKYEKINFRPGFKDPDKISYSITYFNPRSKVGQNNYISGYKFKALENEKSK